jgi:rhodanese-related sulfurtransferase
MKELSPKEAHDALTKNKAIVLLDVRSTGEFAQGHPAGALNIPLMDQGPGGMTPNPDFMAVVTAAIPKDRTVLVTCLSGGRSARAGGSMEQAGWKDVTNVRCGWGGAKNMVGQITEPGWKACGLPTEEGEPAGRSYQDLKKKKT